MKKKRGRPPSRPPGLEPFKTLMTVKAKTTLKALSDLEGKHGYELLETAFWQFFRQLPEDRQKAAEAISRMVVRARQQAEEGGDG